MGISPRTRLEHIEAALVEIDKKLDVRFDGMEARLTKVERAQEGQASTAEFVSKAADLAVKTTEKAAALADEATKKAAALADEATKKATALADDQKKLMADSDAFGKRLDTFDRRVAGYAGAGGILVILSGLAGWFLG